MSEPEPDEDPAGTRELKWATIVGIGAPILFGTFLGNILEVFGVSTWGLQWDFWVQSYLYLTAATAAATVLGGAYVLLGRGYGRAAGYVALVGGAGIAVLGLLLPVTAWWLAGPLGMLGGGRAVLAARGRGEASPG